MKPLSILIADNHDIVRRSVRAVLEEQPAWTVIGEATTGPETLAKTLELMPDIVVLDVGLPGLNSVDVTREIRRLAPAVHVLVLTMHAPWPLARHLHAAGARGSMPKTEAGRALVDAIKVLTGQETAGGDRLTAILDDGTGQGARERRALDVDPALTSREHEVLRLLAEGNSNKEIGLALTISAKTVETHRSRIMSKLRVRSMGELVRYAIRHRIINP